MSFVIHGIGTMAYGERDYWPDGSFITTEWFVLAWLPIIPLFSKRVSYRPDNPYARFDARGGYYVYDELGLDGRQVLFVYSWLLGVIGPIILFATLEDTPLFRNADWIAAVAVGISAVAFVFPYFLRRWIKRRNAEKWKRQAMGLHE